MLAALFQELRRRFAENQLPAPNYRTAVRRLSELDPRYAMAKRHGSKAARDKFGPVGVSSLHPDAPMDIVQIDHTRVDVMVVDRENRLSIGRPWLTLAVDIATRTVVGFSISLENPSALSVSLVLSHAVLTKTSWLADRELQNLDWPMSGLPRLIHVDNAREFHSEALVRGCQEYSIALEHRPRRQPHLGGHIERLIGTMMGAVHLIPGTTFSSTSEKGSYDSEGHAALTLPELEDGWRFKSPEFTTSPCIRRWARHPWRPGARGSPKESSPFDTRRAPKSSFWISCPRSHDWSSEMVCTFTRFATGTTC